MIEILIHVLNILMLRTKEKNGKILNTRDVSRNQLESTKNICYIKVKCIRMQTDLYDER